MSNAGSDLVNGAEERALSARWIFPVDAAPIPVGTVVVRDGRITAVLGAGERSADETNDHAVIIPGLVNAHTHLDLSSLRHETPPRLPLTDWLGDVVARRRETPASVANDAVRAGLAEALRFGTTMIGDIAGGGLSWDELAAAPAWSVCYRETLGLTDARAEVAWGEAAEWLRTRPDSPNTRAGLSPHAPYSVHRAIIEAAARVAPIAIHLAESADERELLERRGGAFVPFLKALGVWAPASLAPSWDWIAWRCSRAAHALLAHGNHLPPATSIGSQSTLVYCPRTHAAFGHGEYPLRAFLNAGHRVALGTDSLASNPDLDVLAEARFVRQRYPDLEPSRILRMATLDGAGAMERSHLTGSLAVGKSADFVVVPVADVEPADPHDLLLSEPLPDLPRRTWWRGRETLAR